MAKKKSKPAKKSAKRSSGTAPKSEASLIPSDLRALEGVMRGLLGQALGSGPETALDRAQERVYEAFDSPDPDEREKIARQALEISPDCADAYVLLAEQAATRREAQKLYEEAVAAGERALGPEVFREDVGHFWGLIETRPYMRARAGLAYLLWTMGRRDEAIGHLREMLRLNPGDNQGLRYTLASWLLAEGRDEELAPLLDAYDEDSAAWTYPRALLAFRKHGDSPEARKRLQEAKKANKHVPTYLLGQKPFPHEQPASYSMGSEAEAILHAADALSGWKTTPGALSWLKASVPAAKGKAKAKKAPMPKSKGPLPQVKKRLAKMPREFDVWQADFRQFGPRVEEAGEQVQPWLVMVMSVSNGLILSQAMTLEPPTPEFLWDGLAQAIGDPMMGEPHRPTELQVRADERWDALKPHLDEIGIDVVPVEEVEQIDFLIAELKKGIGLEQPPALLEMPGVTPELLAGFYEAAASFYRAAPWRKLGFEEAIRVECGAFQSGPWYAIVMGQSGMTIGIALYDDMDLLRKLWAGEMSDEENARETVALTATFDEAADVPDADLDAIERHGFEIAGPEAYPTIFRKERGMSMRPPLAWEIELMTGCLRAIPVFVAAHRPDDTSRHESTAGNLKFDLSWVGN